MSRMKSKTFALAGVILAAAVASGQAPLRFSSAFSLAVEPGTGNVAFIQNGELWIWDGASARVERLLRLPSFPSRGVADFRGDHILVECGDEGGPIESVIVHVRGREVARLPRVDGRRSSPGPGARLSLDGKVVWERGAVDKRMRRELRLSREVPDGTPVVVTLDLASGHKRVHTYSTGAGGALPFRVADLLMVTQDDAIMTLWGGAVVRTTSRAVEWQVPGNGGRPWRLFDVHLEAGLVALGDDQGNLRLLRLSDGVEQAAWRFTQDPAPLERLLQARLGAQAWQQAQQTAQEQLRRSAAQGPEPVDAERLYGVRAAYFLIRGGVVAWVGRWPVVLYPGREEPVAELSTALSALGLENATSSVARKPRWLQQFRRGEMWHTLVFDGVQWREVPPSVLHFTP